MEAMIQSGGCVDQPRTDAAGRACVRLAQSVVGFAQRKDTPFPRLRILVEEQDALPARCQRPRDADVRGCRQSDVVGAFDELGAEFGRQRAQARTQGWRRRVVDHDAQRVAGQLLQLRAQDREIGVVGDRHRRQAGGRAHRDRSRRRRTRMHGLGHRSGAATPLPSDQPRSPAS